MSKVRTTTGTFVKVDEIAKARVELINNADANVILISELQDVAVLGNGLPMLLPEAETLVNFINDLAAYKRKGRPFRLGYYELAHSPLAEFLSEPPVTHIQKQRIMAQQIETQRAAALERAAKIDAEADIDSLLGISKEEAALIAAD